MKHLIYFALLMVSTTSFFSCIEDDFIDDAVDPELSITSRVDSIEINTDFQFESRYLNNVGQEEAVDVEWTSSNPEIVSISSTGLATAHSAGSATISLSTVGLDSNLVDEVTIHVGMETVIVTNASFEGTINTTTFYVLEGTFTMTDTDEGLLIEVNDDYVASDRLPGFYLYLSNNRNSIQNALEIDEITIFRGAHEYLVPDVEIGDFNFLVFFCKPFNIKVGEAALT